MRTRAATKLLAAMCLLPLLATGEAPAQTPSAASLETAYEPEIRPLLARFCVKCHTEDRAEADIDLTTFPTWSAVRKHPRIWQKVGEMLDSGQMPPKKSPQPNDAERARLRDWVRGYLTMEAQARAGDPGRVVLRRLSNSEYTYTLRDLTGVDTLDPAREFPVDGAAGEGFTNTGNALVMSPALVTKYLDAAKDVASHAILLPDGFRFSPHNSRRDWSDDILAQIRAFYREFTDTGGGEKVNLQGIVFDTNQGGRLAVERYLAATLADREQLSQGPDAIRAVAARRGLNPKYLGILWSRLNATDSSLLLDDLRARWRAAKPDDAAALAAVITAWQKGVWRFGTVGHIGKVDGPKAWLEPVSPLLATQELRFKLAPAAGEKATTLSLIATDAGDGNEHDFVVWSQPRLVAPGRPDLLLRDVRDVVRDLNARRRQMFALTPQYLNAVDDAASTTQPIDIATLSQRYSLDSDALRGWLDYLGIGTGVSVEISSHFRDKLTSGFNYDFIKGWGSNATPLLVANPTDEVVRIPGKMKPHSVAVHPAPKLQTAIGWRSPITARVTVEATVAAAHSECGNGITWSLELRRGATRRRLASGLSQGADDVRVRLSEPVAVRSGDFLSVLIGPRDGNHSCDLTAVELTLTSEGEDGRTWNLAGDVAPDVLAANPHDDRFGNRGVWHFYTEPDNGGSDAGPEIPNDSLLVRWQSADSPDAKRTLAAALQKLLISPPPADPKSPDAKLYQQLTSLGGPLFREMIARRSSHKSEPSSSPDTEDWGLDPALFGRHPAGAAIDPASLCVRAPSAIPVRIPADLAAGCELVTTASLDKATGLEGSVQVRIVPGIAPSDSSLQPSSVTVTLDNGQWTSDNRRNSYASPIVANPGTASHKRLEKSLDDFRQLFPPALCYTKIVPVDEVVTLTLLYREDDQLVRLMLDDAQRARLDRFWDELHFVSQDSLTLVDAFAQLMEYASQDANPSVFAPMRKPINDRAAAFRRRLVESEPAQLASLVDFAARAYRRPLAPSESNELRGLYARLRSEGILHDEAFRLTLARLLVAPAFLYRAETPGPGTAQGPISDRELAIRLSYFLWSSQPDDELNRLAQSGQLRDPAILRAQTRRMLQDPKTRRLAIEFGCHWLDIEGFDRLDEKSERHFPDFANLRGPMYEESIQFLTDLFQSNGSVLDLINADYTFLNERLAKYYGIPLDQAQGSKPLANDSAGWRRVSGVKRFGRGGILGQATTLATQSGASRTSPVLRGNWISEALLGERLPRPPKDVPQLPDDETASAELTVRQLVEQHSSDPKCAVCHQRIDAFGFSLEGYDAIGGRRERDLANRPIDTRVKTMDGARFDGIDGLRNYLLSVRREAFLRQFCRKLLGYSLGRAVQLSDELLLSQMQSTLKTNDFRVGPLVESIVLSRQFLDIRGRDAANDDD